MFVRAGLPCSGYNLCHPVLVNTQTNRHTAFDRLYKPAELKVGVHILQDSVKCRNIAFVLPCLW